jgi:hypothetical protein
MAQGCDKPWTVLLPDWKIRPSVIHAVFGDLDYLDGWLVCHRHYKGLRAAGGYTLGWHKVNGKVRAFVKEEHF